MTTTTEYKTRTDGKKEYQVKITREKGLQTVTIDGQPTLVEQVTTIEGPGNMGTSRAYTIAREPKSPEEEAAFLANVREVVAVGLIGQGIW